MGLSPNDRPFVTLHFAQSLDGRIGLPNARTRLSSPEGIVLAHRARAEHDAVLVGSATVAIDDPRLTVREAEGRDPLRVVLASELGVSASARVFSERGSVLVIGVGARVTDEAKARLAAAGPRAGFLTVGAGADGLVSLREALAALRGRGVERLLVEGGARVLTAFVRERLADAVTIEIAPSLMGSAGTSAIGDAGARLDDARVERAGASILVRGRLA